MGKPPTVYDVAGHAGVSIATVSRTLRNPEQVRAATRERVLASVHELGYLPSAAARGLASQRTGAIGLILPGVRAVDALPDYTEVAPVRLIREYQPSGSQATGAARPSELYFDAILRGVQLEAWRSGMVVLTGVGQGTDPAELARDMVGRVDALAVVAGTVSADMFAQLAAWVPVAVIAGTGPAPGVDHVTVANRAGMRALTEHVVATLGIRAPWFVAGDADSPDDAERYAGYVEALADAGIDASVLPVHRGSFTRESGRDITRRLLAAGDLPRALLCANDEMALGVWDELSAAGLRIPGDVVVTGFDGIAAARERGLTTVAQPMVDVGRVAVRTLVARMADPLTPAVGRHLPVTVLLRASSEGS